MNAEEAWNIAYSQLELQLDRASFNTWLRETQFLAFENGVYIIGTRNSYARDMLQHRLYRNIERVLRDVCQQPVEVRFEVHKPSEGEVGGSDSMPLFRLLSQQAVDADHKPLSEMIGRPQSTPLPESDLNPHFIFERFIVSASNRITYEAARAVADNPARSYNPFLIYGGVGLGKTHLLQAVAHACHKRGLHTLYIPSEVFTNDLVAAIRSKTTAMFRDKYRSVDVLLVDDIQFIAGKDSTQEEFFHTFNTLYTFNKQIVLASDRHPRELTTLEDRLRSRFQGGLVSDVQPLEYEARLALLSMWAQERGITLEPSILNMVSERADINIRELEGVFNQIVANARLSDSPLTHARAEHTLRRFENPRDHSHTMVVTLDQVIAVTAEHFRVMSHDLRGKRRTGRINLARQVAMYVARDLTDASLPQIGEAFGGRSHTTVLHGCNKIAEELEYDTGLQGHISKIRNVLMQN